MVACEHTTRRNSIRAGDRGAAERKVKKKEEEKKRTTKKERERERSKILETRTTVCQRHGQNGGTHKE